MHCPLCLNAHAVPEEVSTGVRKGAVASALIPSVYRVDCPTCDTYDIDESALFLLQHCAEVRQRAVTDLRQRGLLGPAAKAGQKPTFTVAQLQSYMRADDVLRGASPRIPVNWIRQQARHFDE